MSYYYQQQYQDETASSSSASPPTTYYRTTSVSPPLSKVSVYGKSGNVYMGSSTSSNSAAAELEARFEASRGFDLEDDLEFCPALVSSHYPPQQQHHYQPHQLHHMNNHGLLVASSTSPSTTVSATPVAASPKVKRKGIEIVDPTTGLKLSGKIRV
ncbi:hypothetical protein D0Z00_000520 [Geotrichum galactomycetum]|uniref:Uncharacterized protein n=1 Tax=Geotrichum galactomycetum TaxID=27317 RepID=A0ACB6V9L1_9ASCO|nr:hypothetical protein D0Z00_000520 [Geotrichum candidum]